MCGATSRFAQSARSAAKRRCGASKNGQSRCERSSIGVPRRSAQACRAGRAPQHETLELSGCRLGQAVHELDPTRIFPRTDRALHMHLELFMQGSIWDIAEALLE